MNINLYFDQFNRVEPVKETKQMENHIDNPSGKSFAEMIVEAQLERERNNNNFQNQKDSEEKSESENNKMIVDHISLSYSQMMLNSLIVSSKKDEDKKRK